MASPLSILGPSRALSPSAEILVWQSSRRIALALAVCFLAGTLRVFDVAAAWLWPLIVALSAYVGLVAVVTALVRRKGDVLKAALALLSFAYVTVIFYYFT